MESSSKVALVIVDHGSRSAEANASLDEVVRDVAERSGDRYVAVLPAHMEIASPTLGEAFDAAVSAGATEVVVALYFLAPGRHSTTDAPRLAAEAAARHAGLRYAIAASLGPHARLSDLVLERATEALEGANEGRPPLRSTREP